ncbi:tocopherol cyclase family protein [Glutamicibacter sp. NPDC087344]|uniref:tocopherol cyclase family protein n=1 Tax=Glutamicibacter sp. NPDC087344 TaxID=3363994 RepID=UPI00381896A5
MGLRHRYRATGADPLFGNPARAHPTVAMEGYFWRVTDPATGRVLIALCGANRGPDGPWSTVGLAAWPAAAVHTAAVHGAWSDPHRLGVRAGRHPLVFEGTERRLHVDLGPEARLELSINDPIPWPHTALGGSSVFQLVPGLNQYWHPWLLGGRASGTATLGGSTWDFENAQVYGEKNWGREGFPEAWWWGQAQGFAEPGVCLAFAGGKVSAGSLRTEVTALVIRLPDKRVIRLGNPLISPVATHTSDESWQLSGRGYGWRIRLSARAPLDQAFVLPVPKPGEHRNVPGDLEHLAGSLQVSVFRFGRRVYTGSSQLAALEHGGLQRARDELIRRGLPESLEAAPPWRYPR